LNCREGMNFSRKKRPHCMLKYSGVMGDGGHAVRHVKKYTSNLRKYHNVENLQVKKTHEVYILVA